MMTTPVEAQSPGIFRADVPHCPTSREFRSFARQVWARNRWSRGAPKQTTITAQRRALGCSNRKAAEKRIWRSHKRAYIRYRAFRNIAVYPGGGTYWAIPWYIVACESGGSWTAYNSSGAAGPYQIMPEWGRPFPASNWHEQMENHRIAADIYAGGAGASNWTCA